MPKNDSTLDSVTHGILLIDKPSGQTSHDVVERVRRAFRQKAVGHAGTLDPAATGLLVLLLGDATRLTPYLQGAEKGYRAKIKLGTVTDSADMDGAILSGPMEPARIKEVLTEMFISRLGNPDVSQPAEGLTPAEMPIVFIKQCLSEMSGDSELAVPSISAVKVKGTPLYQYARAGEEVPIVMRNMNFFGIEYLGFEFLRKINSC